MIKQHIYTIVGMTLLGLFYWACLIYPFKLVLGMELYFASIFTFIALKIFGWKKAVGLAVIIQLLAVAILHESMHSLIISLLELLAASLWTLKKKRRILLPTFLFWTVIGGPYILLVSLSQGLHVNFYLILILAVLFINALFNALLVDAASTYIPYARPKSTGRIHLSRMLIDLTVFSIIGSSFLFILNTGLNAERTMISDLGTQAASTASSILDSYKQWTGEQVQSLTLRSWVQLGHLQELIRNSSGSAVNQAVFYDAKGEFIRSFHFNNEDSTLLWIGPGYWNHITGNLHKWEPVNTLANSPGEILRETAYVYKLNLDGSTLLLRFSTVKYTEEVIHYFLSQSINVLYMAIVIGSLALFLHRFVIRSIRLLAKITTDLPQQIRTTKSTEWFDSHIEEIYTLIQNFSFVTEQLKQILKESNHHANYDTLTGLANRRHFNEFTQHVLETSSTPNQCVAFMFIDLDRFKPINDRHGHAAGDELLVQVADRLRKVSGSKAFVARLGGDEFVIVYRDTSKSETRELALQISEQLRIPFIINHQEVNIGGSIGISMTPDDGLDAETVIKHADVAMYIAKEQNDHSFVFYEDIAHQLATDNWDIAHELQSALGNNELTLHYQPIVDNRTGDMVRVEALARWPHPIRGLIPPSDFIPIAEQENLMDILSAYVIREACIQGKRWSDMDETSPKLKISVNLSKKQLAQRETAEMIENILNETGFAADLLEIEVTEEAFSEDLELVVASLHDLRNLGVRAWVDDFGKGYSSLAIIDLLPIHGIKLDRLFIQRLSYKNSSFSIVRHMINLANEQGLQVVGEGIEHEEEARLLIEAGCYLLQGYYFGKPMNASQITKELFAREETLRGRVRQRGY
ncbi:putative bifunctional diguanylate cyclase/phosphodiesterase [Paenibacillus harenae]|uniref:putative bifunctional diguanylate cyclase/phosphodiesterase n=1 Tax=Paenibacillus harenae TaxID=306543 RepID=UPI0027917884|nr:EAL domain-containing protein [Paenibacillus harenae]MDQ0062157.1 diguanylate cyclase (GGDEF)-like protein [Paenibacillus harenae]